LDSRAKVAAKAGKDGLQHIQVILDSITDGVFTVDLDWKITLFNRAAERITGISREEAIGRPCWEVLKGSVCEGECCLRHTMRTGQPVVNKAVFIVNTRGDRIPISISTALLRDDRGNVIGGVETFRDLSVVEELQKRLEARYTFSDIVSRNRDMLRLFEIVPQVARSDSTVLIEGESGTGKELLARAIHNLSPRSGKPMVVVNCGALPDALLESELFGHKKGAFTDAKFDRKGRFALAQGGTVLLDEIGDISPAMQVRLLRVLQEKTYEPLGSSETLRADVRIIAATNQDLEKLVRQRKFRLDLYYRINVVRLRLPPLRHRKEDIPILVEHFITRFNRLQGKNIAGISPDALAILMRYDYPGNIRELENIIEHSFVLCKGNIIVPENLPDYLAPTTKAVLSSQPTTLKQLEAQLILETLKRNGYNRQATANQLGIHKTTLWRKMKRLGIKV